MAGDSEGETMMRRFYGEATLALALVVGLAALAAAQPPAGGGGMRGPGMRQGMGPGMGPGGGPMAALKLTADQRTHIQEIMQAQHQANQADMQQAQAMRKQLRDLIYSGNPDQAAAIKLATDVAAIQAKHRVEMQVAVAAVLTPEQLKIVRDSGMDFPPMQMGPGGRGGMRGMRGGPPPVKK
jgi:Spy/CpxP family protein refolding chaperone